MDASAGAGVVQANGAAGLMCSFLCSPGVRTVVRTAGFWWWYLVPQGALKKCQPPSCNQHAQETQSCCFLQWLQEKLIFFLLSIS